MTGQGRIAVGVSGAGSNLRALAAAAVRGELGASIVLVFADRACPALEWASEQGIETALVPGGDDSTLAETVLAVEPDVVVRAVEKPVTTLTAVDGPAGETNSDADDDAILAAGVQVARQQLARAK